ncbi:GntR family transcriptional regulator [Peribacillus sp. B-H-3]|uniref:GntR family transcriptional regulator n=1 Tax=Peribacillus sp. B-H-3 TaxID=3400420 RepID=UPI003B023967
MLDITPLLDSTKKDPLYIQLYQFLKKEILSGRISPGEKLPSKRKLSLHLSLSQNTINAAYGLLYSEGYTMVIPRKGVFAAYISEDVHHPDSRISENTLEQRI